MSFAIVKVELNNEMKNINAYILAGGKSSRMGTEKGLVQLNGKSFIEHIIQVLNKVNIPVYIISNTKAYDFLGYPVIADIVEDKGPLGGIYTALMHSQQQNNLIISCDVPFVQEELIRYLCERIDASSHCIVPTHSGNSEPLCAIYTKEGMGLIKEMISRNELGVRNALSNLKTNFIEVSDEEFYSSMTFVNINSKLDLEVVRANLKNSNS